MANADTDRKSFFQRIWGSDEGESEMSFVDHLEALRWHIVRSVLFLLVAAIAFFVWIDTIFDYVVMGPTRNDFISYRVLCRLSHALGMGESLCMPPMDLKLQVTSVSGTFMSSITMALSCALVVGVPYFLWEVWRFVKPALKPEELRHTRGIIFWVSLFFFLGASFGYFMLAPFTFNFLSNYKIGTAGLLEYRPTLADYLESLIDITLGAGLAFQLPMVSWLLSSMGILTPSFLRDYRKYAYVALLVLAAVITPSPDWGSQMVVVVPLVLLYEVSIGISAAVNRRKERKWKEWE